MSPDILILLGLLIVAISPFNYEKIPYDIAAVIGVTDMNLTSCLTTEEAYNTINWKAIILLGGIIPLGIAMQETGAAQLLSETLINVWISWGLLLLFRDSFYFP